MFAYGYLIFIAGAFSYGAITTLMVVNQHSAFISLICLINIVSSLFETFITSSNVLYLSKDNDYLLPLPFMPFEIVASKINTLLTFSYFSEVFWTDSVNCLRLSNKSITSVLHLCDCCFDSHSICSSFWQL